MDPQLVKIIEQKNAEKKAIFRTGKSFLLFRVSSNDLAKMASADDKLRAALTTLADIAGATENITIGLKIEQTFFEGAPAIDLDGPEAGFYLRLTWADNPGESARLSQDVHKAFAKTALPLTNVTHDLDRVFLFVFSYQE
ncbi:hypothetical protein [Pectobacterium sp. CHL-2024]|uniref:hypothetical protein n=1 Tax=Pectobacterium sp. CHL-2024 TaxID=3377079 RepID=UPI00382C2FAC